MQSLHDRRHDLDRAQNAAGGYCQQEKYPGRDAGDPRGLAQRRHFDDLQDSQDQVSDQRHREQFVDRQHSRTKRLPISVKLVASEKDQKKARQRHQDFHLSYAHFESFIKSFCDFEIHPLFFFNQAPAGGPEGDDWTKLIFHYP
jgi:hypothetical protein